MAVYENMPFSLSPMALYEIMPFFTQPNGPLWDHAFFTQPDAIASFFWGGGYYFAYSLGSYISQLKAIAL